MSLVLMFFGALLPSIGQAVAADAKLTIDIGGVTRQVSAEDLLRDPATVDIEVPQDVAYGRTMRYWAMPLAVLLQGAAIPPDQAIEAVASDGFVAILPLDLIRRQPGGNGSVPYLAIEFAPFALAEAGRESFQCRSVLYRLAPARGRWHPYGAMAL